MLLGAVMESVGIIDFFRRKQNGLKKDLLGDFVKAIVRQNSEDGPFLRLTFKVMWL